MAANPFIPVAPPLQDPLQQYGRLVALRQAVQQQTLMQGQQALQAQDIQRGQLQLNDQQAMTQAMHEWDGQDVNELPGLILKHGGSANAVFSTKNQILTYQKNLQEMTKDQLANEATKNDVIAGHIDTVKSLPPDQQPQAFEDAKADLVKRGYLDPQSAQGMAYQGPQQLDLLEKTYMGHTAAVNAAAKQAEQYKFTQQGNLAAAETAQKQPFDPQKVAQLNLGMQQGWQVLHPGQPLPEAYRLGPNATQADFQRLDALMKTEQQSAATKAQRDTANAMRQQSFQLAQENAQDRRDQRNKPTADEQRRADLATNMGENLDALAEIAQRRPDLFGPVAGRWAGVKQWVGTDDPDIARLHAIHEYLGMASVGAHAMRNAQHVAAAADAVVNGFHNSPQAVLAAIGQAKNSLQTFQQDIVNARNPQGRQTSAPGSQGSNAVGGWGAQFGGVRRSQ